MSTLFTTQPIAPFPQSCCYILLTDRDNFYLNPLNSVFKEKTLTEIAVSYTSALTTLVLFVVRLWWQGKFNEAIIGRPQTAADFTGDIQDQQPE